MAKKASVGTIVQQAIASVYTAVAQVKDGSLDDVGGQSTPTTSLDSTPDGNGQVWDESMSTGIAAPGSFSGNLFLDPALAGHQTLASTCFGVNGWKLIYPNSGGACDIFGSSVHTLSRKFAVGEALMASLKTTNSGAVTQF